MAISPVTERTYYFEASGTYISIAGWEAAGSKFTGNHIPECDDDPYDDLCGIFVVVWRSAEQARPSAGVPAIHKFIRTAIDVKRIGGTKPIFMYKVT